MLVDFNDFDLDFIADLEDFFDVFDVLVVKLGNMDEPFLARQDFAEGAEVGDPFDLPCVESADFDIFGQPSDNLDRPLRGRGIR